MASGHASKMIELLVVIAIIVTLAGLLLPALTKAKSKSKFERSRRRVDFVGAIRLVLLSFTFEA